jgi:hypothetical protein
MNEIERALRTQIAEGPREAPVSPVDAVEAARDSRRIRLLIALTDDEAVHTEWARSVDYDEQDRFGRAALVRAEVEQVDRVVDDRLDDGGAETIELLARCGVGWTHDAMVEAAGRDATRPAAAMVLARSTPGALRRRSMEAEVVDDVVEMLRAGAVVGADELWDQFLIWHGRLEELEDVDDELRRSLRADLEGAGAVLDPTLYARGLLAGDYGSRWLADPTAVADLLQTYGPSDWLEVVATVEKADDPGLELAATLAVSASLGIGVESPDESEVEELLDLLAEEPRPNQKESPWESKATELGYGFQVAFGGEDYGLLLAQAAAHERLVTYGIHSPGIRGLPLSATGREHLDAEAVERVVEELAAEDGESDQMLVAAVRTLYDAGVWSRRGGDEVEAVVEAVADAFESTTDESIGLARAHLLAALGEAHRTWEHEQFTGKWTLQEAMVLGGCEPGEDAERVVDELKTGAETSETTLGLDCIRRIGAFEAEGRLEVLGDLWLRDAPVYRAPFVRDVLEEAITVEAHSGEPKA